MDIQNKSVLVTGGAGFIETHPVQKLVEDNQVEVIGNLNSGKRGIFPKSVVLHEIDLLNRDDVSEAVNPDTDIVFHLVANSDVRGGAENPRLNLKQNTIATSNHLEDMNETGVKRMFTSTSTVYGEDASLPTPENYGPLKPISFTRRRSWRASAIVPSTKERSTSRLGNSGSPTWLDDTVTTVVPDFVDKLRQNPERPEILGDGKQRKSYIHVDDCVEGILHGVKNGDEDIYNVGSDDTVSVTEIAEIVSDELGLDPRFEYTGGERLGRRRSAYASVYREAEIDRGGKRVTVAVKA